MTGPIAPMWFVFPLAGVTMVLTAAYLIALKEAPASIMPDSRRRLRTAATWLIMITLPLSAYGFGVATTADPKPFMLVWLTVTALLAFIIVLSSIDLLMLSAQRRQLIREHRTTAREVQRDMVRLASGINVPDPTHTSAPERPGDD